MNALMNQNNKKDEIGLSICVEKFSITNDILKDNDNIHVSITLLPEQIRHNFTVQSKVLASTNHIFSLNITRQTKKIVMIFRKSGFFSNDQIFASTVINSCDFPKISQNFNQINSIPVETDTKTINIYSPITQQNNENYEGQEDQYSESQYSESMVKKIIGNMQVKLTFTAPYIETVQDDIKRNDTDNFNKSFKTKTFERKSQFGPTSNECCTFKSYGDYYLF